MNTPNLLRDRYQLSHSLSLLSVLCFSENLQTTKLDFFSLEMFLFGKALLPERQPAILKLGVQAMKDLASLWFLKSTDKVLVVVGQVVEHHLSSLTSAVFVMSGLEKLDPNAKPPNFQLLDTVAGGLFRFQKSNDDLLAASDDLLKMLPEDAGDGEEDPSVRNAKCLAAVGKEGLLSAKVWKAEVWDDTISKAAEHLHHELKEKLLEMVPLCQEKHRNGQSSWKKVLADNPDLINAFDKELDSLDGGKLKDLTAKIDEAVF